jgi:hypothetical protein
MRQRILPRAAPGVGGAGLYPHEVLRTPWGPRNRCAAGADAGEGRA